MIPSTSFMAAALSLSVAPVLSQTTGQFSLLTFNVAGLPKILNDNGVPGDKSTNSATIGSWFAQVGYDVIHVQEDFNYHKELYSTDNHTYRTETSGPVPFGSGLNTLANYGWSTLDRVTWDECFINQADCLTPKGFSFMRMQLASGVEIDLYNVHADAGDKQGDIDARLAGVQQMLAYINTYSAGRAAILAGDFNDRWSNAQQSISLLTDAGFADSWVVAVRGGVYPSPESPSTSCPTPATTLECEVVDKVFFRSGDSVTLSPATWDYESDVFVQPDGSILSDHNPIRVDFSWTA